MRELDSTTVIGLDETTVPQLVDDIAMGLDMDEEKAKVYIKDKISSLSDDALLKLQRALRNMEEKLSRRILGRIRSSEKAVVAASLVAVLLAPHLGVPAAIVAGYSIGEKKELRKKRMEETISFVDEAIEMRARTARTRIAA